MTPDANGHRLLTTPEAANILNVPASFLYEESRKGPASRVPHVRIGRYVRYRPEDLARWIESRVGGGDAGR